MSTISRALPKATGYKYHALGLKQRRIHRAGDHEISNVKVEYVWIEDKPGMEIHFDVAMSIWFEVHEGDYYYDDYDENIVWMMVHCRGDLDKTLTISRFFPCQSTMERAAPKTLWTTPWFPSFRIPICTMPLQSLPIGDL